MMTDPIADMLTRIRNSVSVEHPVTDVPSSKIKRGVAAEVLKREGYIWDFEEIEGNPGNVLRLELKYGNDGEQLIQHIKRISKPGRRIYAKAKELRPILNGMGITVISSSQGVISDREARTRGIGGEVLCEIY